MRVGSVFSGIGGFDEGFRRAGFDIAWMCEREPFCRKVLARHFPDVPCFDDVTTLDDAPAIDVLVGGFPCQDVSVAGKREGLGGERTGLFFQFMRLVDLLQPKVVVLENVPGLLTSQRGRDFHTVLSEVAERGLRRNYRILDSQYFGVPQRRRRVFLVGSAGGFLDDSEAVLFESTSRVRDSAKGEQARARVAASLRGRSHGAGVNEPGRGGEDDVNLVVGGGSWPTVSKEMPTLTGRRQDQTAVAFQIPDRNTGRGGNREWLRGDEPHGPLQVATAPSIFKRHDDDTDTLIAATLNSGGNDGGFRTEPGEHLVASPVTASAGHHGRSSPRGDGRDNLVEKPLSVIGAGVRRLTPLECERLQGFPDGWTCLCGEGHHGSQFCSCPDTPRYKALGNAVTVSVAEWIARRLMVACAAPPKGSA